MQIIEGLDLQLLQQVLWTQIFIDMHRDGKERHVTISVCSKL